MGCDIHFHVEKQSRGRWVKVADKTGFYDGRNYDLFAILANVRNGRGFAGCDTGDGYVPISPPKGLPADVSAEVRKDYELKVVPDNKYTEEDHTCSRSDAERWLSDGCSILDHP